MPFGTSVPRGLIPEPARHRTAAEGQKTNVVKQAVRPPPLTVEDGADTEVTSLHQAIISPTLTSRSIGKGASFGKPSARGLLPSTPTSVATPSKAKEITRELQQAAAPPAKPRLKRRSLPGGTSTALLDSAVADAADRAVRRANPSSTAQLSPSQLSTPHQCTPQLSTSHQNIFRPGSRQTLPGDSSKAPTETKVRLSAPTKNPSCPSVRASTPNQLLQAMPAARPNTPPKPRPSTPTRPRPNTPPKNRPSTPTKHRPRPNTPPKNRPMTPTKHRVSMDCPWKNKQETSAPTKHSADEIRSHTPNTNRTSLDGPLKNKMETPNSARLVSDASVDSRVTRLRLRNTPISHLNSGATVGTPKGTPKATARDTDVVGPLQSAAPSSRAPSTRREARASSTGRSDSRAQSMGKEDALSSSISSRSNPREGTAKSGGAFQDGVRSPRRSPRRGMAPSASVTHLGISARSSLGALSPTPVLTSRRRISRGGPSPRSPSPEKPSTSASRARADTVPPASRIRRQPVVAPPDEAAGVPKELQEGDGDDPEKGQSCGAVGSSAVVSAGDEHDTCETSSLYDAYGPWGSWDDFTNQESNDEPVKLFELFRVTEDIAVALEAFARLYCKAVKPRNGENRPAPWARKGHPWRYPYEPIRVLIGGHWKAKQLWEKLDKRCARPEYQAAPCEDGHLGGQHHAVVVGAGPSGLRAAIELRLLGSQVTVVERRETFSRLNRLHLWHWCAEEMKALGARCLEPPPLDFGTDPDLLHVGIGELQMLLLKVALLLGVQVLLGTSYNGFRWSDSQNNWVVDVQRVGADTPSQLDNVAALVGAGGLACGVGRSAGLESLEVGSLRSEEAIGLVCNFQVGYAAGAERSLRSFALARQFYDKLFIKLSNETGAELENIVYTKSKASHYFVMTPTRRCLAEQGVLKDITARPALAPDNVNREALDQLVRRVVAFRFKEGSPTLQEAFASSSDQDGEELKYADSGPQLFDFSKMKRAADGLLFLDPPEAKGQEGSQQLLVALAGDALVEPFWPEGLGIIRGFFGALDVAWAAARWSGGADPDAVRAEFSTAFGQLKSLAAQTRGRILRENEGAFGLAPHTRYRGVVEVQPPSP